MLVADDAGANDYFGCSVSVSGDYAVVGAGGENGTGTDQGAAYVFYRNQGGADNWGQVKKIVGSDTADDDGFGYAVAIDGTTIVVGADGEDGTGTDQGAAYVFYQGPGRDRQLGPGRQDRLRRPRRHQPVRLCPLPRGRLRPDRHPQRGRVRGRPRRGLPVLPRRRRGGRLGSREEDRPERPDRRRLVRDHPGDRRDAGGGRLGLGRRRGDQPRRRLRFRAGHRGHEQLGSDQEAHRERRARLRHVRIQRGHRRDEHRRRLRLGQRRRHGAGPGLRFRQGRGRRGQLGRGPAAAGERRGERGLVRLSPPRSPALTS